MLKRRIRYRVPIMLLLLIVTVALFGRGVSESQNQQKTEIEFWHPNSGLLGEAMTELTEQFNQTIGEEKQIVVREIYQGKATDVATKLRASLQAQRPQDLPDLAQIDATGVMDVRESDYMIPIQNFVEADPDFSLEQLQPGTVLSMTYKDVMIGMPFNASTILLYYNKDAFSKAGLDPERPPETLAELAAYAKKLKITAPDGKSITQYGFAGVPSTYELVSWIGQQQGVSYITDKRNGHDGNPTQVVWDTDGTLATFLDAWRNVYESGGLGNLTSDVRQQFIAGKTAMFVISTSSLATILDSVGDRFTVGAGYLPKVDETATGGVNIGGGAIFIFDQKNDARRAAAWEFLKFLTSAESQLLWHQRTGYFPVNMDTYELDEFKQHTDANPLFGVAIDQLHDSDPRIQSVWWPNSYQAYYDIQNAVIEMLEGGVSTDQTVQSLSERLNRYMQEYNRMNP